VQEVLKSTDQLFNTINYFEDCQLVKTTKH